MPDTTGFLRPDLQSLIDQAESDISSRLIGADARLPNNTLGVLARVISGQTHGLYGYLEHIARQSIVDRANAEDLNRHGSVWTVVRKSATKASGYIVLNGTDGTVVAAGTEIQRGDNVSYFTDVDGTVASGTLTLAVTAALAGLDGNAAAGVQVSLVSPISGLQAKGVVDVDGLSAGTDIENDDNLRDRVLFRIQKPPHGGAKFDYEGWALQVAGVTRAWVYPAELGLGTVTVRFVMDAKVGTFVPDAGEVQDVQDHINSVRPVTSNVTVVAPTAVPMDFTIALEPATQAVKDAVEGELSDLLTREAEPGATILISHIREAVSISSGENDNDVVVPTADVTHTTGEIATMGTITWQ
jgi:uncharacterized phage protein gp47/JayE